MLVVGSGSCGQNLLIWDDAIIVNMGEGCSGNLNIGGIFSMILISSPFSFQASACFDLGFVTVSIFLFIYVHVLMKLVI